MSIIWPQTVYPKVSLLHVLGNVAIFLNFEIKIWIISTPHLLYSGDQPDDDDDIWRTLQRKILEK